MSKLILELERLDFIQSEWVLYDKGIKSLKREMLKPIETLKYDYADEVYVCLGKDKHYLKKNGK